MLFDTEKHTDSWNLISGNENANLSHRLEWKTAFKNAYGHTPLYLFEEARGIILPSFIIKRPLFGSVLTTMPFLDSGGPVGTSEDPEESLIWEMFDLAHKKNIQKVEIRTSHELSFLPSPFLDKVAMLLQLPQDEEVFWRNLDAKVRNQIRKARKNNLSVRFGGLELLTDFYKIFCVNMRDLGSPVHSRKFFMEILTAFSVDSFIAIVESEGRAIGGLIGIVNGDMLTVPWASSLRKFFKMCPNMLMYWETLARASRQGIRCFDFGRSTRDVGTYRFKKQWGAVEKQLYWYHINLRNGIPPKSDSGRRGAASKVVEIWKKMPLGVANRIGPIIRKYISA